MTTTWLSGLRGRLPEGLRPYFEPAPLAALFLGISSGFGFAMIGATLTTRLAQHGVTKSAVTAFTLTILASNLKFLWAPVVDHVRLPVIGRYGQRRSWLWLAGALVMVAVACLGIADPADSLYVVAIAAIAVGVAGATFDIIIDAYRIELLEPRQLGVGSGMSQYGWRNGAAAAGAIAAVHRGRRARPGSRGPSRLGCGLLRLRRLRAPGNAGRPGDGRAPPASRAREAARRGRGGRCLLQPAGRVHEARRGGGRPAVRADTQDR